MISSAKLNHRYLSFFLINQLIAGGVGSLKGCFCFLLSFYFVDLKPLGTFGLICRRMEKEGSLLRSIIMLDWNLSTLKKFGPSLEIFEIQYDPLAVGEESNQENLAHSHTLPHRINTILDVNWTLYEYALNSLSLSLMLLHGQLNLGLLTFSNLSNR